MDFEKDAKAILKEDVKTLGREVVKFVSESDIGEDAAVLGEDYPPQPSLIREGVAPTLLTDLGDLHHDRHSEAGTPKDSSLTLRMTGAEESQKNSSKRAAFTLAETLITLGVIGVVAAITLPVLMNNVQERVRKEQVRTAKYKLTLATDKMKSLGLINAYPTTMDFVNELKKHLKIAKVCDSSHIADCWPTDTISVPTTSGTFTTKNVSELTTGKQISALGLGTYGTNTVSIVTADGIPMIMTYSPECTPLDSTTTYSWSTVGNKPETNATTNCISAIFDVNGRKGPNKIGQDVRTLNSLFGYVKLSATPADMTECVKLQKRGLITYCNTDNPSYTDYYAGAVKKCNELGMHLPSFQTLAVIAGAKYGRTDIGPYTLIMKSGYGGFEGCGYYYQDTVSQKDRVARSDKIICVDNLPNGSNTAVGEVSDAFWSSLEMSNSVALRRDIGSDHSSWLEANRGSNTVPLCVGD